jgi:hypothetical protein
MCARRFTLEPIAESGDRFADFSPFVPSINDAGTVAFQAALLNPVSVNACDQLAIRIRLADRRQLIVRADPSRSTPSHT